MQTASLGLSGASLLLLAEADENSDGQITYQEFVPLAVEVIQTMRLKARYDEVEEEINEELRSPRCPSSASPPRRWPRR